VLDVRDERVDEGGLDAESHPLRRALDRTAQLVLAHRADEDVVGGEQPRQLGIRGAAPVVVRTQRQHDDAAAAADQLCDEGAALTFVAARHESLLELVDGDDGVPAFAECGDSRAQLAHRVLAGPDDDLRPPLASRQHAVRERG
jgi:hypothetical protein